LSAFLTIDVSDGIVIPDLLIGGLGSLGGGAELRCRFNDVVKKKHGKNAEKPADISPKNAIFIRDHNNRKPELLMKNRFYRKKTNLRKLIKA
jgi:hypothetical protein